MSPNRDEHIGELARQIWESEGRPSGENLRHWYMAVRLIEAHETPDPYQTLAASPDVLPLLVPAAVSPKRGSKAAATTSTPRAADVAPKPVRRPATKKTTPPKQRAARTEPPALRED